jgi:signal transduction histidine kinase
MPILAQVAQRAWWPAGRAGAWSAVGVIGLLVLGASDLAQHYNLVGGPGAPMVLTVVRLAPLALAWARPVQAIALSVVTATATTLVIEPATPAEPWPWPVTSLAIQAVLLVVLGLRCGGSPRRRRLLLVGAWLASQIPGIVAISAFPLRGDVVDLLPGVVLLAAASFVGELVGARADLARVLAEQRADTEAERAHRAQLEERARLARELHDVVAHHLSVVVARADSAPMRLPEVEEQVREEFNAIAEAARNSLTEMRRVLRLLRADGPDSEIRRSPLPGLADLGELIDGLRAAGAIVTITEPIPTSDAVPPVAQLIAYRVVQEALTNAIRHAPGAPITVCVAHGGGLLRVGVVNARTPLPVPQTPVPQTPVPQAWTVGHGLRGIAERVAAVGGAAQAQPLPDGGFQVTARIPTGEE